MFAFLLIPFLAVSAYTATVTAVVAYYAHSSSKPSRLMKKFINANLSLLRSAKILDQSHYDRLTEKINGPPTERNEEEEVKTEKKEEEPPTNEADVASSSSIVAEAPVEQELQQEQEHPEPQETQEPQNPPEPQEPQQPQEPPPPTEEELRRMQEEQEKAQKKRAKMLEQRSHVLQEILSTEETYVKQLTTFTDIFLKPIRQKQQELQLSGEDIRTIFSDIEIVLTMNTQFLSSLRACVIDHKGEGIGLVMTNMVRIFSCYKLYISNFNASQERVKKYVDPSSKAHNSKFARFVRDAQAYPECSGYTMEAFLILPVQRIPRYCLLLKELLKNTPDDHPDYKDISTAYEKVQELANLANAASRDTARRMSVVSFVNRLDEGKGDRTHRFTKEAKNSEMMKWAGADGCFGVEFVVSSNLFAPTRRLISEMSCVIFCDPSNPEYAPILHTLPRQTLQLASGTSAGQAETTEYNLVSPISEEAAARLSALASHSTKEPMSRDQLRAFVFTYLSPTVRPDGAGASSTVPSPTNLVFSSRTACQPVAQPSSLALFNDGLCVCYAADSPFFPIAISALRSHYNYPPIPTNYDASGALPLFLQMLEKTPYYSTRTSTRGSSIFDLTASAPVANLRVLSTNPLVFGELVPFHDVQSFAFSVMVDENDKVIEEGQGAVFSPGMERPTLTTTSTLPTSPDFFADAAVPNISSIHSLVLNQLLILKACTNISAKNSDKKKVGALLEFNPASTGSGDNETELEESKTLRREGVAYQTLSVCVAVNTDWAGLQENASSHSATASFAGTPAPSPSPSTTTTPLSSPMRTTTWNNTGAVPAASSSTVICERVYLLRGTPSRLAEFRTFFAEAMHDLRDDRNVTVRNKRAAIAAAAAAAKAELEAAREAEKEKEKEIEEAEQKPEEPGPTTSESYLLPEEEAPSTTSTITTFRIPTLLRSFKRLAGK